MTTTTTISSLELRELLESAAPPRVLDVRTPAEFESAHIAGSANVPLNVLDEHTDEVVERLKAGHDVDVVLVCRSGQRATKAGELLAGAGLSRGRVLDRGITDWQQRDFTVHRGVQRWDLERQVRLVAGSIVLSSILGSVAVPRLKWLAAAIGGGLTFAAVTDTCAMGSALAKLPYNNDATSDAATILARLDRSSP